MTIPRRVLQSLLLATTIGLPVHPIIDISNNLPMSAWNRLSGPETGSEHATGSNPTPKYKHLFKARGLVPESPMAYSIGPVVSAINLLIDEYDANGITVVGLGEWVWATNIVTAIDTGVRLRFPNAGSYALVLRQYFAESDGDAERIDPALYMDRATWLDLYLPGALESERQQHQILNLNDPCCFHKGGVEHDSEAVRRRLIRIGLGSWKHVIEYTYQEHAVSSSAGIIS